MIERVNVQRAQARDSKGSYQYSWRVDRVGTEVWFGAAGGMEVRMSAHLSVDDAEAIGYSLLYAAKLAREGSGTGGE